MKTDIADIYRSSWTFALACPLLFLIPALVELAQHFVEWKIGMYDGPAAAKAVADNSQRMYFGFAKTLALLLPGYWFTRFILFGRDAARARRLEFPAIGLWLIIFAFGAVQQWWGLFGPPFVGLFGLGGKVGQWAGYGLSALWGIVTVYFIAWVAAWPLGNRYIGPIRSAGIMNGSFWYSLALLICGTLPLMFIHYALGFGAIFAPSLLDWPLLILDALCVGFLALTLTGASAIAARHAANRKGLSLLP